MSQIRILSEHTVRSCVEKDLRACFDTCASAYRYYGRKGAVLSEPSSLYLELPSENAKKCRLKGAHFSDARVAGFRLASPGSYFTWVIDSVTGEPKGLVAENWLHRRRTAVTGALTLSWLRPDIDRIALIGAGKIGFECAITLGYAFPTAAISLGVRDVGKGSAFLASLPSDLASRMVVQTIESAVRDSQAVLTITKADRAFIRGEWLQENAIALSMGGVPEFDFQTWERALHFVLDDLGYALKQGDLHHWVRSNDLTAEEIQSKLTGLIGDVALEPKKYQILCSGLTLAVIQGMAICDIAMAELALATAEASGLGNVVDLELC